MPTITLSHAEAGLVIGALRLVSDVCRGATGSPIHLLEPLAAAIEAACQPVASVTPIHRAQHGGLE